MTLTLVYTAIARNLSAAALASLLGAVPLDTSTATLLGLTLASDTPTSSGNLATRTIVYTIPGSPPVMPADQMAATFTQYYTVTFTKALATPVTAAVPVVA